MTRIVLGSAPSGNINRRAIDRHARHRGSQTLAARLRGGERGRDPTRQRWEGEVGGNASVIVQLSELHDTPPSRCCAAGPSLSPLRAERGMLYALGTMEAVDDPGSTGRIRAFSQHLRAAVAAGGG